MLSQHVPDLGQGHVGITFPSIFSTSNLNIFWRDWGLRSRIEGLSRMLS